MREVINPKNVHWPFGFSHIVKMGDTVYISGQLPQDQDGNIVGKGDMVAQTEKTYENLKKCLESVGAKMHDIVMLRILATNLEEFQKPGTFARNILANIDLRPRAWRLADCIFPMP